MSIHTRRHCCRSIFPFHTSTPPLYAARHSQGAHSANALRRRNASVHTQPPTHIHTHTHPPTHHESLLEQRFHRLQVHIMIGGVKLKHCLWLAWSVAVECKNTAKGAWHYKIMSDCCKLSSCSNTAFGWSRVSLWGARCKHIQKGRGIKNWMFL